PDRRSNGFHGRRAVELFVQVVRCPSRQRGLGLEVKRDPDLHPRLRPWIVLSHIKVVWGAIVSPTRQRGLSSLPRWRVGLTKTKTSVRPRPPAAGRRARPHGALLDDRFRNFGMRSIRTAVARRLIVQHSQGPPRHPLAPLRNDDRSRALQER